MRVTAASVVGEHCVACGRPDLTGDAADLTRDRSVNMARDHPDRAGMCLQACHQRSIIMQIVTIHRWNAGVHPRVMGGDDHGPIAKAAEVNSFFISGLLP